MLELKTHRFWPALGVALALAISPAVWADDALNQGLSNFKAGKYAEAAAEFQSLVDTSPSYDYGYFMLGLSLLKMGKFSDAETNVLKAIELNGDKFEYHNGLATVYFTQKDYAKAVAALRTAEPLASSDAYKFALYSMRGNCYAALDKWADAIEDLEKARAINPQQAPVLVTLGQSYYKLGHFDKAAAVFRQAVKLMPNDTGTVQLLAESLLNLGAEAKTDAEKDAPPWGPGTTPRPSSPSARCWPRNPTTATRWSTWARPSSPRRSGATPSRCSTRPRSAPRGWRWSTRVSDSRCRSRTACPMR
jgi:tetratricopeptide (TPR) repeat protein